MTPMRRFLLLLLFIAIGVGFGIGFGAIFYKIRKKKDDQISVSGSINEIITPSIAFWVAVGIIILLKIEYCIPMKILVMSGIILAGFLSAISSKKAWLFFLCFGVVVVELGLEVLIRRFVEWVNCTNEKRKAKIIVEAAEKAIGINANPAKVNPISPTYNENKELRHVPAPKKLNIDPPGSAPILNNINNSPPQIRQPSASAPPINNLNINNQKKIYELSQPSAPPINKP